MRVSRRSAGLTALAVVVVAALVAVPFVLAGGGDVPVTPDPDQLAQPTPGPPVTDTSGGIFELTPAQEHRAVAIARADPTVQALLRGRTVRTTPVVWTTGDARRLIGADVEFAWASPATVTGRWPVMFYDTTETLSPPYATATAAVGYTDLTGVGVMVDLARGRVVGINPDPNANQTRYAIDPGFHDPRPPQPRSGD